MIRSYEELPKKTTAASAILRDEGGRLLIVKPTYKEAWLLPGGQIEELESPQAACVREIQEELSLR